MILSVVSFSSVAQADLKIAYVNANRLIRDIPLRAAELEKATKEFAGKQEELKKMQAEFSTMKEKYTRERLSMTSDERDAFEKKLIRKEREFKWNLSVFEEDQKIRENEINAKLNDAITRAINKIGQNGKYDLILRDSAALFASQRMDLTSQVLEFLKKESGGK
jgi:outer membrane protein